MFRIILAIGLVLSAPLASAMIILDGVSGASAVAFSGFVPQIYGGMAGPACAIQDGVNTCDSCKEVDGLKICNRQRIYPSLLVTIAFVSDEFSGIPMIQSDGFNFAMGTPVMKGNTAMIILPWSQICPHLSGGAGFNNPTCSDPSGNSQMTSGTFRIGIDSNYDGVLDDSINVVFTVLDPDALDTGIYDVIDDSEANEALSPPLPGIEQFLAYPGREKIYLEDLQAGVGFPTTMVGTLTNLNVYLSSEGFITTPYKGVNRITVIPLVNGNSGGVVLADKEITDLPAGVPQYLRVSVSDISGNEMFFTSDAAIMKLCGSLMPFPPFDGTEGGTLCPFAVTPVEAN